MTDAGAGRVIVIGAGHNGLVCAAYLARAGRKVLVLEAAGRVGGAAVTREFAPGFNVSAGAHLLHLLDPEVAHDLALGQNGLSLASAALKTVALSEAGTPVVLDGAQVLVGDVNQHDRAALADYVARMHRFAALLGRQHGRPPPRLAWEGWRGALPAAHLALDLRRLGRADMREFLRIAAINIFDVLEEAFESPQLKGVLALDGVLGGHAGPRSGNTVLAALHRMSGQIGDRQGAFALPRGGMGAVTGALAAAARHAGAEIRTGVPVTAIRLDGDRVTGVRLADGEEHAAETVVSSADPKTTLLALVGARNLEAGFVRRVHNLRMTGAAAKLHLALSGLPAFRGLPAEYAGERLVIAPDPDYIERAFNHAKYRQFSDQPALEITIPTVHDPALAPAGHHVLSAIVQYAPYHLAGDWYDGRERFREIVLDVLERHATGLRGQVLHAELLVPADFEREFGMHGGHWHHGELALDQFLMLRPVPGFAQYAMPVGGLYLCGAGCHPGGGVMGSAGRNAAHAILGEDADA